jgi:two-component system chemotaxis sensor kinase CheA
LTAAAADPLDFTAFLDEYFVECDDHLTAARRCLLALEASVNRPDLDRRPLDELFRSFHTVKGLSAMVGVAAAERLAHHLETYLGQLRKGQAPLTPDGLDVLIAGVKALDAIIAARRDGAEPPDVEPLLARLNFLAPDQSAAPPAAPAEPKAGPLPPDKATQVAARLQAGARAWQVTFQPAPALAARGVNVNSVRQRLQQLGELVHAAPAIRPGGKVAFEFLLVGDLGPAAFEGWAADGLTYHPYPPPPAREAPAPVPANGRATTLTPANLVRVDLGRLDDLMWKVGELVLSRARLEDGLKRLETVTPAKELRPLQETNQAMERQLRDLRERVMRVRMVPVREVFARMPFVVRDLAREAGKQVGLQLAGEETEIDKFVVERMTDPLLHLVRNAVSHGLETPAERTAAGKPAEGRLRLRAAATGETVVIEVEDDGRGIDAAAVFARARAAGVAAAGPAADPGVLLDVLCTPGFSTRDEADRASGRGVGMDVVRRAVEDLGGALTLDTQPGRGTRFGIHLPLTLAITDALIVRVAGERYAVPQAAVREVVEIDRAALTAMDGTELLPYHGGALALLRLRRFFGAGDAAGGDGYALVVGEGTQAVGLTADRLLGLREVVVRPLTDRLVQAPGLAGATELGDGRVVLILDPANLVRAARRQGRGKRAAGPGGKHPEALGAAMAEARAEAEPYILCELAGTTYAVPSRTVQQMEMVEQITPVPNAAACVDGVVFARGRVVPVLNLRRRFGREPIPVDLRSRLVVVAHQGRAVGLLVDSAREFVTIAAKAVQPPPEAATGAGGQCLAGIATVGDRLVLILDVEKVLNVAEPLPPAGPPG